jgi:hypothetical protein
VIVSIRDGYNAIDEALNKSQDFSEMAQAPASHLLRDRLSHSAVFEGSDLGPCGLVEQEIWRST